MQHKSPFVTNELRPRSAQSAAAEFYELTPASVHPTVVVGVDDMGMPIEETRPPQLSRPFVMLDGCVNHVPIRTGVTGWMEPEAQRYEQQVTAELISRGCMPLEKCPYTFEFSHFKGGQPLARPPAGEKDCGGSPKGCVHMHKIMDARLAVAKEKHDKTQLANSQGQITTEQAAHLIRSLGNTGAGSAPASAKGRLVAGKDD